MSEFSIVLVKTSFVVLTITLFQYKIQCNRHGDGLFSIKQSRTSASYQIYSISTWIICQKLWKMVVLFQDTEKSSSNWLWQQWKHCSSANDLKMAFLKIFVWWYISPFCGITGAPVLDFWWCLPWVSKPFI